ERYRRPNLQRSRFDRRRGGRVSGSFIRPSDNTRREALGRRQYAAEPNTESLCDGLRPSTGLLRGHAESLIPRAFRVFQEEAEIGDVVRPGLGGGIDNPTGQSQ